MRGAERLFVSRPIRHNYTTAFLDATSVPYPSLVLADHRGRFHVKPFPATGYSKKVVMTVEPVLEHERRVAELALAAAKTGARVPRRTKHGKRGSGSLHRTAEAGGRGFAAPKSLAVRRSITVGLRPKTASCSTEAVERALGKRESPVGVLDGAVRGRIVIGNSDVGAVLGHRRRPADHRSVSSGCAAAADRAPAPAQVQSSASWFRGAPMYGLGSQERSDAPRRAPLRAGNVQARRPSTATYGFWS